MWEGASSLLYGCCCPVRGRIFSTVQVEALRIRFDHVLLLLSVCLDPWEVIAEQMRSALPWRTYARLRQVSMVPLCSSPKSCPFFSFSVMLIPNLVQGCDVEEAMLGIRALWLPELRWFALQLDIWAASVVDFSHDPSAPDLALSCGLEWKESRWSHWERKHCVLLPRACLLEIHHLAAACSYGSVPCACWQWPLWLLQDHISGAPA